MNKVIVFFFFFFSFSFNSEAKETNPIVKKENTSIAQKKIAIDIDGSLVERKFEDNFKKKYSDSAFIYEYKAPEKNAWDRFKEWLANVFNDLFRFSNNETSMNFVEILLKTIAVLIVLFVIYMIVKAIVNREGQWIFGKNSSEKIPHYNEIEKNIHLVDFEKLIKSMLQSDEKRLCIRYFYLWLLKKMSDKKMIVWDIEKTNSDYLYELKSQSQKDEFAYLSYLYNCIWYGEFELDENTFAKARAAFEKTIKSIGDE